MLATPALARPADQASRLRDIVEALVRERDAPLRAHAAPALRPGIPIIAIGSGKGGVGKTNLAVNLCIALARSGRRATLLDADLGMANADVLCGLSPHRRLDALLVAHDAPAHLSMRDVAVDAPGGFLLVPGAVGVARVADLDARRRTALVAGLAELESVSDLVVIDTGAGIGRDVTTFMLAASLAIVVATPEPTSIADAYGLIKCLHLLTRERGSTLPRLGLVVNQARSEPEASAVHARLSSCAGRFLGVDVPFFGWIAQDSRVSASVRNRLPHSIRWPRARASRDVRRLSTSIIASLGAAPPSHRNG
ncbi:MAG: AAA family ATPase [Phycisphaerales bacterium]|nr:AAA family ATPase [Phycisphaerales bacterium]